MAITQDTFNGNGSNLGPFTFTFKWLESTDIKVTVDGTLKTAGTHYNLQALNYTTKNGGQVLFTAGNAPTAGTGNIRVYRETDDSTLSATFSSGSAIRAADLNNNFTQNLYVTQETKNAVLNALLPDNSVATSMIQDSAVTSAKIADGTIVNADVNTSAAIAGTKISPNFGSQNVTTTGTNTAASLIPTSSTEPTNGLYLPGTNTVGISTNGTGRLFIDANGNVGIGMTPVDVAGFNSVQLSDTNGTYFDFYTSSTQQARIISLPGDLRINQIASGTLGLWTSNTERLRIDSSGRVGIGTSSPTANLEVGTTSGATVSIRAVSAGSNASPKDMRLSFVGVTADGSTPVEKAFIRSTDQQGDTGNAFLAFGTREGGGSATERLRITPDGKVGIGTSSPQNALVVSSAGAEGLEIVPSASGSPTVIAFNRGTASYAPLTLNGSAHILQTSGTEQMRIKSSGIINFSNAPVYADNAAATTGGLAAGDVYRTSTGQLMIRY